MYNIYAVMSGNKKYHASFVLENGDKKQEIAMREHYKKVLNKKSVKIVEYYNTDSKDLATSVATNFHKRANAKIIFIDASNPEDMEISRIVEECMEKLLGKTIKHADFTDEGLFGGIPDTDGELDESKLKEELDKMSPAQIKSLLKTLESMR